MTGQQLRILTWGTYDLSKPRGRILLRALQNAFEQVEECHVDIWGGVADKSQVSEAQARLRFAIRWLLAYPRLLLCWYKQPRPDMVFIGYLGQIDVLVLWPFAKLRGVPIVWDAFISLYNTVVEDRKMFSPKHPVAWLLYSIDWLACRAADRVVLDTRAHADYFVEKFGISHKKTDAVFVGAETEVFRAKPIERDPEQPFTVLFYGQFIPLHGIPTIIEAARLLENEAIRWVLIGKGQEEKRIVEMLDSHPLPQLEWIPWVRYEHLIDHIIEADVCLGIFDNGAKAARVIPNKVFQLLSAGKPIITRDSPAVRELIPDEADGVWLVTPNDPASLAKAIRNARENSPLQKNLHSDIQHRFSDRFIQKELTRSFGSMSEGPN